VDEGERRPPHLPRKSANPLFWILVLAAGAAVLVVLWNLVFN
jgi:hypothetical protein